MTVVGATACSTTAAPMPFYGAPCLPDCGTPELDAADESPVFPDVSVDASIDSADASEAGSPDAGDATDGG